MKRHFSILILAVALAWSAGACGGGGGGGTPTTPTPPPPPPDPIDFTAAGAPGALTVHLAEASGTADNLLRIEIRASDFADLYGLGFDLLYPTNLLDFQVGSEVEGGHLSADGTRTEIFARQVDDGRVIIGLSRVGDAPGVEGSGLLLTLDFVAVANGSGSFSYKANDAFDSNRRILDETVWQAGDVRVSL